MMTGRITKQIGLEIIEGEEIRQENKKKMYRGIIKKSTMYTLILILGSINFKFVSLFSGVVKEFGQ